LFWYRFMFANRSYYEMLGDEDAAAEIIENLKRLSHLLILKKEDTVSQVGKAVVASASAVMSIATGALGYRNHERIN